MEKSVIKDLIMEYQAIVEKVKLIPRSVELSPNFNYVFVGLRRAGKSYLMYQQIQRLLSSGHGIEEILYFNFEDDRLIGVTASDLDLIKRSYEELYHHTPIFFLDEIQLVAGWEKFVRRLADQRYRVYVTGSNARMLSSEIATTLGGRFVMQEVFPYSFPEYLHARGITLDAHWYHRNRSEVVRQFESYFLFGGLPELNLAQEVEKRLWLTNLFNKIFFGDLLSRFQIRNDTALKILIRRLAESVKQPSSYTRLTNIVSTAGKKIKTDTIIDYLSYLRDTWLIFPLENLASKLVDRETNKKYYFIDNGLLNLFLTDPSTFLLENIVAIQLRRLYPDDLFFYHHAAAEVDFVLWNTQIAIQVCYTLRDTDTREREVKALLSLPDSLNTQRRFIITKDEAEMIERNGKTIEVIPVWQWLFGSYSRGEETKKRPL
ncbi:MAG: ATP-binding protein [Prevotellaceae bacterium]|jgi:predicted AAA+ superfamily ATPase|nr:ATP-binding protein [Prevotellaceae bacterium]